MATIFSLDPNFSLWGEPRRSGGFVNFAFYIIFAILAFLILRKEDWQKIWNFAILIGVLVSFIAIFQWQGLLKDFLITYETRPPATLGNPIMLALYLLLLSFLTLSFAVKETKLLKKILYFSALFLFIFVIILTYSRAAYLGLTVGFLWFLFFFPKKMILAKVSAAILLILSVFAVYYVNTQPQLPDFVQQNKTLQGITSRLSIERAWQDPRISGWKVSWQALKDRPLLGYGPENLSIGFEKHYDPSLPHIGKTLADAESWWDRAHNFVFDISLTAGIPGLFIFLLLFGVLLFKLGKIKETGLQAAFIGYLVANFFSFDVFSIYLVLFLLVGYSLYLIKQAATTEKLMEVQLPSIPSLFFKVFLFVVLIWFVWVFNVKPFQINSQINIAAILAKENQCDTAITKMEKVLPQKSFLDSYLRLKYVEIISQCIKEKEDTEKKVLMKKAIALLEEAAKIRPYYTRTWLLLGAYNRDLMKNYGINTAEQTAAAFEKAYQLSPKRAETLIELNNAYIQTKNYPGLVKTYSALIELEPNNAQNYASLAFVYKELGQIEEAKKTALKIIELFPEHRAEAENFLKTLD